MADQQDTLQEAKELYDDAEDAWHENFERMDEDFCFSNPADPQQWTDETRKQRDGRVLLTLDQTNQYINQVVNDGRQNTPSMSAIPGDGAATADAADQLTGIFRHIEYVSRAGIAYDTSLEHGSRAGMGFLRVYPKIIRPELNHQELYITSVSEPRMVLLDPDSRELDGCDSLHAFVSQEISKRAFKRRWPKASEVSFGTCGKWALEDGVRVAEFFKVVFETQKRMTVMLPGGSTESISEDEYTALTKRLGYRPVVLETFDAKRRKVKWLHMTGAEILEETWFPGPWVPVVPVYGHMMFVEGKRYVCGLTRRLMDGQRFHNIQMTALAESLMTQPKAPYLVDARAIAAHMDHWEKLADGNPAYLPFDSVDEDELPIQMPQRVAPAAFPSGFAQAALMGQNEMQAAVGIFKSTLGQQSNAVSGKAKLADKLEGDTATFHYRDNQRISIEHLARICIDAIPEVYDTPRVARMLGIDGSVSTVRIDPDMQGSVRKQGKKVVALNPNVGVYDAVVKIGPAHTTLREEFQDRLTQLAQSNPALAAAIAPLLIKMGNVPEAEKLARVAIALLPPNVQAIYNEGDDDNEEGEAPNPQIIQLTQQLQQAREVLQNMQAELQKLQQESASKQGELAIKAEDVKIKQTGAQIELMGVEVEQYNAETQRIKVNSEIEAKQREALAAEAAQADQTATLQAAIEQMAQGIGALLDRAGDTDNDERVIQHLQAAHDATVSSIGGLADLITRPRVVTPERDPATGMITRVLSTHDESQS
jgi:hypothetical protein